VGEKVIGGNESLREMGKEDLSKDRDCDHIKVQYLKRSCMLVGPQGKEEELSVDEENRRRVLKKG